MGFLSKLFGANRGELADSGPLQQAEWNADFVVVDVETACSRVSSICQIGIVGFRDGREVGSYGTLVDPRDTFDARNTQIHGIAADHVRGHPHFGGIHPHLSSHLEGRIAVAHSTFDRGALAAACDLHGRSPINSRWLDSVVVARHAWPHLKSHRLNVLADHLGIEHRHHDALSDARTAGLVMCRAMEVTGIDLEGWFGAATARPKYPTVKASPKREASGVGPLAGHSVAMSGEFSVSRTEMADLLSAGGAAVTTTPTRKTTIFLLGALDPTTLVGGQKSAKQIKAEALAADGQKILFLSEKEVRAHLR